MFDKDHLENAILDMYKVKEFLGFVYEEACEAEFLDQDVIANLLLGNLELFNSKLNHLYRIFDEMESDGNIE